MVSHNAFNILDIFLQITHIFSGSTALVFEMITLQDKGEWSCQGETGNIEKSFNMVINRKLNYETSFTIFFIGFCRDS